MVAGSTKNTTHQSSYDSAGYLSNDDAFHSITMHFSKNAIRRWHLGLERKEWVKPRKAKPRESNPIISPSQPEGGREDKPDHFPYFEPRRWDFSSVSYDHPLFASRLSALVACVYGGIHALAWNFFFPSSTEKILWRLSSVTVIAFGPALTELVRHFGTLNDPTIGKKFANIVLGSLWASLKKLGTSLCQFDGSLDRYGVKVVKALASVAGSFYCYSLSVVWLPVLFAARLFFIVEPFVAFRRVPTEVYTTVSWSNYIPHLS